MTEITHQREEFARHLRSEIDAVEELDYDKQAVKDFMEGLEHSLDALFPQGGSEDENDSENTPEKSDPVSDEAAQDTESQEMAEASEQTEPDPTFQTPAPEPTGETEPPECEGGYT